MTVAPAPAQGFETHVPILIVGAGAAGLCAALSANEAGGDVVVIERDAVPRGSTALSAGLIPAADTKFQRNKGIADSVEAFAGDIQRKAHGEADQEIVDLVSAAAGPTIEWLADRYELPFSVVHDFDYPGHSARRMHGLPTRSGTELIDRLRQAVEDAGVPIVAGTTVRQIYVDHDGSIRGIAAVRPDGGKDDIGCDALVLACNGYGGNPALVAEHIAEMASAQYFGHAGNQGDAVLWGTALGAQLSCMTGYQGHGSVAHPHAILITWAVIMEGGFQVNAEGRRFSDESGGYSEQAAKVIAQPGSVAYDVFDERIAGVARQFEDFRNAEAIGAVITADTAAELAHRLKVPENAFIETFTATEALKRGGQDSFGRDFSGLRALTPPFKAVRVTGGLFHTQGGLAVDTDARVLHTRGGPIPGLFAAGGAAAGVSGRQSSGYLSGNGLLTATILGRIAGQAAAAFASR